MAFVSYEQREDFQDETFKMVAGLVVECIKSQVAKDALGLFDGIDAIYTVLHKRLKKSEELEEKLNTLRKSLYSNEDKDPLAKSKDFDRARKLWKQLAGELDEAGLLLRERLDKSEVVTRE